jgi:hypothetical protein
MTFQIINRLLHYVKLQLGNNRVLFELLKQLYAQVDGDIYNQQILLEDLLKVV